MQNDSGVSGKRQKSCNGAGPPKKDTKSWGDLAELTFVPKTASLGITASKPYGDRRPYDFLVECGQRLLRVQVKSVFTIGRGERRFGFPIAVSQHRLSGRATYTADEIDFIAAFVASHDAWYVIPVDALSTRKFIRVYPAGKKRVDAGLYEHCREAWHLMKGR
jgi:PD-(D/E)XK endonuclease